MGRTLATLSPPVGAKKKPKRVGRGPGSGWGTTAGRGQKGQGSRSGGGVRLGFEGGQTPLQRRIPKRGFKNPFRVDYFPVNLSQLAERFSASDVVDLNALKAHGMVPRKAKRVKILANGDVSFAITVRGHAFSAAAVDKIKGAGGTAEVVTESRAR